MDALGILVTLDPALASAGPVLTDGDCFIQAHQVKNKLTNPYVEPFSGKITRPFTYLFV